MTKTFPSVQNKKKRRQRKPENLVNKLIQRLIELSIAHRDGKRVHGANQVILLLLLRLASGKYYHLSLISASRSVTYTSNHHCTIVQLYGVGWIARGG